LALAAVLDHLLHIKSTAGEFRMRDGHLFEIDPDAVLTGMVFAERALAGHGRSDSPERQRPKICTALDAPSRRDTAREPALAG
jgi:hypothetical protein